MINELVVFFKLGSFSINPALPGLNKKGKEKIYSLEQDSFLAQVGLRTISRSLPILRD